MKQQAEKKVLLNVICNIKIGSVHLAIELLLRWNNYIHVYKNPSKVYLLCFTIIFFRSFS